MKLEIELNEAQIAQIFWSLGQAIALLKKEEVDSRNHVPIDTLQCLGQVLLMSCAGYDKERNWGIFLRSKVPSGGTSL